ncbi:hypothetical protein [Escherichia phage vB_EcoP_IUE]
MRVNEEHYHAGFVAGCDGLTDAANPHPRGTGMHHAWQSGWAQGHYASAFRRAQQHAEVTQSAAVSALGWLAFWVFVVPVAVALVVVVASFFW